MFSKICVDYRKHVGRCSSVGIATELRAGRSKDRILVGCNVFRTRPVRPWGPPSLLYNGYRVFPGGKERPGRDAHPWLPSSAVGHERVELYLYSSYGPYGLYRASVPVQGWPLPFYYIYHPLMHYNSSVLFSICNYIFPVFFRIKTDYLPTLK